MTATAPTAAPARRLPSKRLLWWIVPIVLILGIATALSLRNPTSNVPLSPHNPAPAGARAMAEVLKQQGVQVRVPRSAEALADERIDSGTTVVVTQGVRLSPQQWRTFAEKTSSAGRVVLLRPGSGALEAFEIPADRRSGALPFETEAGCSAELADDLTVKVSGERYAPRDDASGVTTCFGPGGGFDSGGDRSGMLLVAEATDTRPEVVAVGTEDVVRNADVLEADNAALGLRALGAHERLVWWNVGVTDIDHQDSAPPRFPGWVGPVWVIALLAIVLLMVARGRRFGKLITEPLPVIVRADETTRARGQLYRKAGDVDRAGAVLRTATRRRLASYLQVGRDDRTLVAAVATASRRATVEVEHLLLGPPPTTEAELTTLAQGLHDLEREIRPR